MTKSTLLRPDIRDGITTEEVNSVLLVTDNRVCDLFTMISFQRLYFIAKTRKIYKMVNKVYVWKLYELLESIILNRGFIRRQFTLVGWICKFFIEDRFEGDI